MERMYVINPYRKRHCSRC